MECRADIARIMGDPKREWEAYRNSCRGSIRTAFRELDVDWDVYNTKDYLFTHDTIVASVATEEDGFTIKPNTEDLVNGNGNAWTNEVLLNSYKTFIGGENYFEHVQAPAFSKGKILDAIIRQVKHRGEDVYVVDILVATNRIHASLVDRIERGELKTMSMGATANYVQCSVCGKIFDTENNDPLCTHLTNSIGKHVEYNGKNKFCAELCGAVDPNTHEYIKDSCVFIEASWVEEPAYEGAVTNFLVETPEIRAARVQRDELERIFNSELSPALRVADRSGKIALGVLREMEREERIARSIVEKIIRR